MTSSPASDPTGVPGDETDEQVSVLLFMERGEDRRLLADWFGPRYDLTLGAPDAAPGTGFDLCIVDVPSFQRDVETLEELEAREEPVFFPILLLDTAGRGNRPDPAVWEYVDDVIETPIRKAELRARLSNLLQRRRTSAELADRERALERTVAELERKERAIDAAPVGVTITDPDRRDNPTVYANAGFERITGYDRDEAVGRNMRFLQGPATDDEAVRTLREAVDDREPVSTTLVNYRADGTRFWNRVDVAPVRDESGALVNFVGFQTDVTDEKIREQRLSVLNRMMRHNLSNDLNVVEGYADTLLDEVEDPDRVAALEEIERAAEKLESLGEDVSRVEYTLDRCRAAEGTVDLTELLDRVRTRLAETHPDADLSLDVEGGPWYVTGSCLDDVFAEAVENALRHNDAPDPAVAVSVRSPPSGDHVEVRIVDNGSGLPDGLVEVFREGEETQLNHADGLGLWLVYWAVTLLGGDVGIPASDGTVVTVTLPTTEPEAP
jgi:PAS domain S-box-containing protein